MKKEDIIAIADGLRLIEEGVEKIQNIMRDLKIKSLADVAAQLLPIFKAEEDALTESIIKHLDK